MSKTEWSYCDKRVDEACLILKYIQKCDLVRIVESEGPYKDDVQLRDIVTQIMRGLDYLHDNNIL